MKKKLAMVEIDSIIVDEAFQCRVTRDDDHLEQMVDALRESPGCLPRIDLVEVAGLGKVLVNGFARLEAHQRLNLSKIPATVIKGDRWQAILACAEANKDQLGRHRTTADKRKAVDTMLRESVESGKKLSDREIARHVGCTHSTVGLRKKALGITKVDDSSTSEVLPERKPKAKKKEVWENMLLEDCLDVADSVWDSLRENEVRTAGELMEKIEAKVPIGLDAQEIKILKVQVERIKDGEEILNEVPASKPLKSGDAKGFDFKAFNSALKVVAQAPDVLADLMDASSVERRKCIDALTQFHSLWDRWVSRLYPRGIDG